MRRATLIDGSTQSITRDDLGRRTAVTTPWWSWTVDPQNGYDPAGNLTGYTTVDPVGTLSVTNNYDDLYHLTTHNSELATQNYSYDSIGNRLESLSTFLTGSTTSTYAYAYNELNELVLANRSGNLSGTVTVPVNGLIRSNPITAQAIASITVQLDSGTPVSALWAGEDWSLDGGVEVPVDGTSHTITVTATDDDGKQSVKTVTVKLDSDSSKACLYDLRGNLVQQALYLSSGGVEITSYRYDALNRLLSVSSVSSVVQYRYDYLNRRISKTVTIGTGGSSSTSTEYYLWSGMNEIGALDADLNLLQFRMLGEGLGAEVGSAVAVELRDSSSDPWKTYIPIHDFRGNIVCLVDKLTSTIAESYRYDAYGNARIYDSNDAEIQDSAIHNPWRFSSKRFDSETGYYYFTHRYYDSSVGRFVTTDPLGVTDGVNMYGYAGANPMMFVDPSGLLAKNIGKNSFGHLSNAGWSIRNIGVNLSETWNGNKWDLINPLRENFVGYETAMGGLNAGGWILGIPASFVTGDIYHNYGNVSGAENFAVNGMTGGLYNKGYAKTMAGHIEERTGQQVMPVENPSWGFGVGSLLHTILGELGIKMTPSVYVANALRAGANGYNHSQGALVVWGAKGALSDAQRSTIQMQSAGPEIHWATEAWGFKRVINTINPTDIVPRLSPLNVFGGDWVGLPLPWKYGTDEHGWNYYKNQIITFD
jgi:RHS repeat-associated protein